MEALLTLLDLFRQFEPTITQDKDGEPESLTITIPLSKAPKKLDDTHGAASRKHTRRPRDK